MIKAIIFDFDGLIIDTETAWYEAYRDVYRESYNVDLPLDVWAKCIGTSFEVFNPLIYLEERANMKVDRDNVRRETKDRYTYLMKDQTIRPGVLNYLQEAKKEGLKIGLASSSNRRWINEYLKKHELIEYFDSLTTSDDVSKVKPDPELYLRAADLLQVKGKEAIAFEDSLNGLRAAKSAGLYCVIVPNSVTAFLDFDDYDMRLDSMEDVTLKHIINTISG